MKIVGPVALYGAGDVWTDKFIILGDGSDSSSRVICVLRDNGVTERSLALFCSRNIDGPPNATSNTELLTDGSWNNLQFEFRSSSSPSSGNGQLKIWNNVNAYSSPTRQSGLFQLNTTNWGNINVGFYANTTMGPTGRLVFQLADVEFDDEFNPNFHSGSGGSTDLPAAPRNLRITPGDSMLLAFGVLGLALEQLRRKRQGRRQDS
jgi:hypothetical protein